MVIRRTATVDDFDIFIAQDDNTNRRFELINGEIVEKMPTQLHAYIVALLTTALMNYLKTHPIGWALVEARYRLPDDKHNDRIPDLSFVNKEKGKLVKDGPALYMPDLAIEVQSPGQSDKVMSDKAIFYLQHGTHLVWLIYPEKRLVEILTTDDRALLTENDMLDGGAVLPDFSFTIRDLFTEL